MVKPIAPLTPFPLPAGRFDPVCSGVDDRQRYFDTSHGGELPENMRLMRWGHKPYAQLKTELITPDVGSIYIDLRLTRSEMVELAERLLDAAIDLQRVLE